MQNLRIGFIGAGNMAQALVRGILANGVVTPEQIRLTNRTPTKIVSFCEELKVEASSDNAALCQWANLIFLAVKPQMLVGVLESCRAQLSDSHLLVSVAAGTHISTIAKAAGNSVRIVRAMPNTPSLVGAGATALCAGPSATPEDLAVSRKLMEAVGMTAVVTESQMDAVTGLSGSGPAYVLTILEALADGAVRCGLPRDVARQLATQTVLGSAQLLLQSNEHPAALRDRVTSPGGTTAAGLSALEEGNVRHTVASAVHRAAQRSIELGKA